MEKVKVEKVKTGRIVVKGRLSYPRLFKAESYKDSKPRYSASILIDKGSDTDKLIRSTIMAVGKEFYVGKPEEEVTKRLKKFMGGDNSTCYKESEEDENVWRLSSTRQQSQRKPGTLDRALRPVTEEDGLFYAGCQVAADVDIWLQDGEFKGIRCTLNAVQYIGDGEPIGGGGSTRGDLFEAYEDEGSELI